MPPEVKRIFLVAGARPNFMKIAPLYKRLRLNAALDVRIVHTGQHYDAEMSDVFFQELGLPDPDVNLRVGSGSQGAQTGRVLELFERALAKHGPAAVVVVGDVNSTLACALASVKMRYSDGSRPLVAHVEAGLRSGDRSMPEEINRIVTDAISDVLFTTDERARENLLREGVNGDNVYFVGNVMIDCLLDSLPMIEKRRAWAPLGLERRGYGVVTLHRPSNVDAPGVLGPLMTALDRIAEALPLVFPVHPRTRARMREAGIAPHGVRLVHPLGYQDFMSLVSEARLVLTDSGGLQEESTFLRVPCLTLRDNTERPVTLTHGTNQLVGSRPKDLVRSALDALNDPPRDIAGPPLWDGLASQRIAEVLLSLLAGS